MTDPFRPEPKGVFEAFAIVAQILPRVYKFLWQASPGMFSLTGALLFVMAMILASIVWMTKVLIDAVVASMGGEIVWMTLVTPVVVILGLWILQATCESASSMIQQLLNERAWNVANQRLQDKAGSLDLAFFESPKFYDQLHHAKQQLHQLWNISFSSLALLQQAFTMTAMIGLLAILHPLAIVVLIACSLPKILIEVRFARMRYDLEAELIRNDRMAEYLTGLVTERDNAKEIRIFGLKDYFVSRFMHYRDIYIKALRRLLMTFLKINIVLNILSMGGVAVIWAYAVYEAVMDKITLGDLTLVFQSAQQSRTLLTSLISSAAQVHQSALFASRFFEFLDLDPQSVTGALEEPRSATPPKLPGPLRQGIEFQNVSFSYPGSDDQVLRDVSFTIPVRKNVAIVGQNGAGKTTIIKLLARFYDPETGAIIADGQDLREYSLDSVRKNISVTFQDFSRYDVTAADNIGFGHIEALGERPLIEAAAKKGGIHQTMEKLPKSYDTMLGKTFDEGVDLSGGEWQQLAVSRAFMSDAQVLILDEPTASLDAMKEHQLYENFAELTQGKTVVFISHRFSTVRMADVIVVLENGTVVETGSHQDLMEREGKYAEMFLTQAERYR